MLDFKDILREVGKEDQEIRGFKKLARVWDMKCNRG